MPYNPMETTFIPNTTMQEFINSSGNHTQYCITPNEGYVLHDKRNDYPELDENFMETGNVIPRFATGMRSVSVNYDFTVETSGTFTYTDENGITQTISVTMIGEYEFYTLPANIVPENQKFGGGDNDHEVM